MYSMIQGQADLESECLPIIDEAYSRLILIKSIDPMLDFGNGITAPLYAVVITNFEKSLIHYNTALGLADENYNIMMANLTMIKDWNKRVLAGIAKKYGKESREYALASANKKIAQ